MSKQLLMNILLMLVWVALTGSFAAINFLFGFILAFFIMWLVARRTGQQQYFTRFIKIIGFLVFFFKELIKANVQVAYDVVTPRFYMTPAIVKVPLDVKTDLEITLLANLITLTPGTLALDISDDRKVMYVHGMFVKDRESFIHSIKSGFERRLLEIMR